MKDSLYEILLKLCESSLDQIQKNHQSINQKPIEAIHEDAFNIKDEAQHIKSSQHQSTRVITSLEQVKLTKASHQFLMRMTLLGIINADLFEIIINQLQCSESRIINLKETKWTMRTILARNLSHNGLAFLDLVLYQKEDEYTIH